MKKKILTVFLTAVTAAALTACGGSSKPAAEKLPETGEMTEEEQDAMGRELEEQTDQMVDDLLSNALDMENGFLDEFSGEMDLEGSWEDETSRRAMMDISMNEDGSCTAIIYWGGSAFETAVWEITGTYDPASGSLSYDSARHYCHVAKEDGTDEEVDETTTDGVLSKEGDKLLWQDSANGYEDHFFVKYDGGNGFEGFYAGGEDDTLTIMEEEGGFSVQVLIGGVYYDGILVNEGEGLSGTLKSENGDTASVTILAADGGMELTLEGQEPCYYENAMTAME